MLTGFSTRWYWWMGNASNSSQFNFPAANVFAVGALGAVQIENGKGTAYVGITEETAIDPNTGRSINKNVPTPTSTPVPILVDKGVSSVMFVFGSSGPNMTNTVGYADASLTVYFWT